VGELLIENPPRVDYERKFADSDKYQGNERKRRSSIAFPLAYMAFLILILSGSSMRVTGFSAEKQSGMMELLMSSVIFRREMVLSKLITGVIYGLVSVLSYMLGIVLVFLFENKEASVGTEFTAFVFPQEAMTLYNIIVVTLLFSILTFLSMQIVLASQLVLGKEAGDRAGSMFNMALSFIFYFSIIGDALAETPLQIVNPFFWPFRIAINLIFRDEFLYTLSYSFMVLLFSSLLLKIKTISIEKEKSIYD
ncbi:MAG: ABC transporter permease, partial [Candidatus Kariarchaeaceae archaeon]